jgi:DNA-binding transcriptional ArsR family regulator
MKLDSVSIEQIEQASNMLKAIAHPMRISILGYLDEGKKLTVTEIHELLQIDQSSASHHLGILKDKGILVSKREGKNIYYSLKNSNFSKLIDCLSHCACQ